MYVNRFSTIFIRPCELELQIVRKWYVLTETRKDCHRFEPFENVLFVLVPDFPPRPPPPPP